MEKPSIRLGHPSIFRHDIEIFAADRRPDAVASRADAFLPLPEYRPATVIRYLQFAASASAGA